MDFLKKLTTLHLPDDVVLVSLDVVSLFTNVPVDLILEILEKKWSYIHDHTRLPKNEFISATKFILQSTFFHFNNKYYKQTFGVSMGSPLSPIVADLVL